VGVPALLSLGPPLPRLEEVGISHGVLAFSIFAGLATGCLFGLAPAILVRKDALSHAQAIGGRTISKARGRYERLLIAVELALTVVLLVSGGLFVRSLANLSGVDPGFDARSVATVRLHLPRGDRESHSGEGRELLARILSGVRALPGVESAGGVDKIPFPGRVTGSTVSIAGREVGNGGSFIARNHFVLPGYMETMGIPLLAGRAIADADVREGAPPVMLINELMARRYWRNESALGARIEMNGKHFEVVGIVGNVRERHLSEDPKVMVWEAAPASPRVACIVAKSAVDPAELIPLIRRSVWDVDPEISLSQQATMADLVAGSTGSERYRSMLVVVFATLATLVAAVGVFGVTAHSVSKRVREMGIRIALGAQGKRLIRGAASETMLPCAFGIAAGVLGALAVARMFESYLFGVPPWDATTIAVVVVLLGLVAAAAAVVPASRVLRVNPMQVLREE